MQWWLFAQGSFEQWEVIMMSARCALSICGLCYQLRTQGKWKQNGSDANTWMQENDISQYLSGFWQPNMGWDLQNPPQANILFRHFCGYFGMRQERLRIQCQIYYILKITNMLVVADVCDFLWSNIPVLDVLKELFSSPQSSTRGVLSLFPSPFLHQKFTECLPWI